MSEVETAFRKLIFFQMLPESGARLMIGKKKIIIGDC